MTFESIQDIRDALKSGAVSVRDLHRIWEQGRRSGADATSYPTANTPGAPTGQFVWLGGADLARDFTRHCIHGEEYLLAWEAAREIVEQLWPSADEDERTALVRVRLDSATALLRLGRADDARDELERCLSPGVRPALGGSLRVDILVQLGDTAREQAQHQPTRAAHAAVLAQALGFYSQALALDPVRLDALVNTAVCALTLGGPGSPLASQAIETSKTLLARARELEDAVGPRLKVTKARAAAYAVLGQVDSAARCYQQLNALEGATTAELATARFEAQFLAMALGGPPDLFKPAFPPLQLIVFAGHLPDRPGSRARLPPDSIEQVRASLRAQLDVMQARAGLASAAAGGDLLFSEALRARPGGNVHIVLPWSRAEFRRTSVLPFEQVGSSMWEALFEEAIEHAATLREIGQVYEPSGDVGWQYMVEVTAGIALHMARASRLDVQPMVLWDGQPGRGTGGTDSFYTFWSRQLGLDPVVVSPPPQVRPVSPVGESRPSPRCERPTLHQEVKSMLFADIVGYSKLTERAIPEFVGYFLERVSRLASSSRHAPCSVNTWGDAVYAVFDFTHDAGSFALELAEMVRDGAGEWLQKGLYWEEPIAGREAVKHPLNLRIGLHAGPVVLHYDPVVRRLGFTGGHVNRAARIEPLVTPGEILASEEFAALTQVAVGIARRQGHDVEAGFVCQYAGSMLLAKGYPGRYRIYRVLRRRAYAIEELARAAHMSYTEEAVRRGETISSNSALLTWERLPEDLRQANRAQAADIPNKLRRLGLEMGPAHGHPLTALTLTDTAIEELARAEHERWMHERLRAGWVLGPTRDNARKHHPMLVPWEELPDVEKEKDRDAIRKLPQIVNTAGFRLRSLR